MAQIGLIEYNWENPEHEKQYVLPMFVPGSAEFFNMKWENIVEHPEVASFFERMTQLPLEVITPMVPREEQESVCMLFRLKSNRNGK